MIIYISLAIATHNTGGGVALSIPYAKLESLYTHVVMNNEDFFVPLPEIETELNKKSEDPERHVTSYSVQLKTVNVSIFKYEVEEK